MNLVKPHLQSRYKKASLGTRFFLLLRWWLTPYFQMVELLPSSGKILDLGCGHGLLVLAIALKFSNREILGIDHDADRVQLGAAALKDFPNVDLHLGNIAQPSLSFGTFSAVTMIDVLHYFNPTSQEIMLKNGFDLLLPGGILLAREVDPHSGITSRWNRLYEKIATRIGFTRSDQKELYFRSQEEWIQVMEKTGFRVKSKPCSHFLFADMIYICERPSIL